jgi:hypothetical protein
MRLTPILLAFLLLSGIAHAQEPNVFEVVIPAALLNQPVGFIDPEIKTIGQSMGGVTAYGVEGARCAHTSTSAGGDAVLRLGLVDQPEACRVEGAVIVLVDDHCRQLATTFELRKGTRATLTNLAPTAVHAPFLNCIPPTPRPGSPEAIATNLPRPQIGTIAPPNTGDGGLADD